MNEFEKKLLADLQKGHSVEDILAEFNKHLSAAQDEYDALEAKRKADEEAEAKSKAEAEKARAERAKTITDLANRLLNNEPTAADVAWVFQRYFATKWSKSEDVLSFVMNSDEVEQMVEVGAKMLDSIEPLMKVCGMTWEEALKNADKNSTKTKIKAKKSDEDAIRDFIKTIM